MCKCAKGDALLTSHKKRTPIYKIKSLLALYHFKKEIIIFIMHLCFNKKKINFIFENNANILELTFCFIYSLRSLFFMSWKRRLLYNNLFLLLLSFLNNRLEFTFQSDSITHLVRLIVSNFNTNLLLPTLEFLTFVKFKTNAIQINRIYC